MANLPEANEYPAGIYQIETTDPVLGGPPNEATKAGLTNIPAMQLAKRTSWLKARVDLLLSTVIAATTLVAGIVRLSNATNSTSETLAATPAAVKAAMDNANTRAARTLEIKTSGLATGGGNLTQDRTITVPVASQSAAQAGEANDLAMTPLRVAQAIAAGFGDRSFGTNGYQVFPGGLIIQWGYASIGTNGQADLTFPIAFPTLCWNVSMTDYASDNITHVHSVSVNQILRTGFRAFSASVNGNPVTTNFYFIAIGR